MPSEPSSPADPPAGDTGGDEPRVLLFMRSGRDRSLLGETLGERYHVETTTDVGTLETEFDCCVFDAPEFNRVGGTLQPRRDTSDPAALPFVLLVSEDDAATADAEVWEYVDDVVELPVTKAALYARIGNLIERRRTAVRLAEREARLERTVDDLALKERAMDEAPIGITIAEPEEEDAPLIYANEGFEKLTGYDESVVGSDCRFLQGERTDEATRDRIREAIDAREPVSVDIFNYRKNGRTFWNKLDIAPISGDGGATRFVGFQTEITERKIREQRLRVLNRVLSHNLRNVMSVIQGHAELLKSEFEGEEPPASLAAIESSADDLMGLADAVRDIEQTVQATDTAEAVIPLEERVEELLSGFRDRFPEATFDLTLPEGDCEVALTGVVTAIEEAIENAIKHNDSPDPSVEIRIRTREGWVDVEIEDDGPGIPEQEITAIREGETALSHADRLGLWLIYWVLSKVGGSLSVSEADPRGTILTLSVPAEGGG